MSKLFNIREGDVRGKPLSRVNVEARSAFTLFFVKPKNAQAPNTTPFQPGNTRVQFRFERGPQWTPNKKHPHEVFSCERTEALN